MDIRGFIAVLVIGIAVMLACLTVVHYLSVQANKPPAGEKKGSIERAVKDTVVLPGGF